MRKRFSMVSLRLYALCVLAIALAGACGGDSPDGAATPSPTPTPGITTEASAERDGVLLSLSVDKGKYVAGELVSVSASVENRNAAGVDYIVVGEEGRPIGLAVVNSFSGEQVLKSTTPQQSTGIQTLEGGGVLTREATWDLSLDMYQTPVEAPPGEYSIKAEILLATAGGSSPHAVFVTFEVEGGQPVVAPESAIAVAVLAPEVQSWYAERGDEGGILVCTFGQRGLFYSAVMPGGEVAETFDFLYQQQLEAGLPICSVVTEGENWRVLFSGPAGPPPQRISAFVDLHDGSLRSVDLSAPTPRPTS